MPFISKQEMQTIQDAYRVLNNLKPSFCGPEIATINAFCDTAKAIIERQDEEKALKAEYMRKRRTDPKTRDRAKEIDRKAIAKFRAKQKTESK